MPGNHDIDPEIIDNAYDPDAKFADPREAPFSDENVVVDDEPIFDPNQEDYDSVSDRSRLTIDDDNTTQTSATQRREFKYSTANMQTRSRCWKFLLIGLAFGLFLAISMGISMLIQHLFFGDESDNGPLEPTERDANATFPQDKVVIDQVCSSGTFDLDDGARCRDACEPRFNHCCDPFSNLEVFNADVGGNSTNSTNSTEFATTELDAPEVVFDDDSFKLKADTCTFDTNIRGCMSYSKCQANSGLHDPAPGTLPILCHPSILQEDPEGCEELCRSARCCFSDTGNCLAENLAVCMDYSPCQNLRTGTILATAPDDLDRACLLQLPECFETCQTAECCGDPDSTCFQENFLSCMTYAPCHNITTTSIAIPPQFGVLDPPPRELALACNEKGLDDVEEVEQTCEEYCKPSFCCYAAEPHANCFRDDPLGCLAYNQECQVLFYQDEVGASAEGVTGSP